ncbi:MAG: hypothetical protein AAF495_01795 [Pseudomonadota bacterium]
MAHLDWRIRTVKLSICSCYANGIADIKFDYEGRYAFLINVTFGPHGIVE